MKVENKQDDKIMASKIRGGLLLGALGDALGVPTEMREKKFLQEKYGIVDDFLPAKENLFFNKNGFAGDEIGFYSDDTTLTFAIVKSLTEIGGIDIQNIFKKQIQGYYTFPYGFGGSTRNAFEKIEQGLSLEEISNNNNGRGNGVMMKQFPLAVYFTVHESNKEYEEKIIVDSTRVSHGYPAAVVAAVVHHNFLKILLKSDPTTLDKKKLLQNLAGVAQAQENKFTQREGKKISEIIDQIAGYIDEEGNLNLDDNQIFEKFGWKDQIKNSGFITTTLGIVYCLFLRNTGVQGVWDAVNFGGDTDTYASIIGNMSGALHGEIYDENLLAKIQGIEILKQQVHNFILNLLY